MTEENNYQDVFMTHGYKRDQEVFVNAEFIIGVLSFCQRVQDYLPKVAALTHYPKSTREIRDKETDELVRVDIEWAEHTAKSFSNTAFTESGGVGIVPDLAMFAVQIQNALTELHIKNINEGIAVKIDDNDATQST